MEFSTVLVRIMLSFGLKLVNFLWPCQNHTLIQTQARRYPLALAESHPYSDSVLLFSTILDAIALCKKSPKRKAALLSRLLFSSYYSFSVVSAFLVWTNSSVNWSILFFTLPLPDRFSIISFTSIPDDAFNDS